MCNISRDRAKVYMFITMLNGMADMNVTNSLNGQARVIYGFQLAMLNCRACQQSTRSTNWD